MTRALLAHMPETEASTGRWVRRGRNIIIDIAGLKAGRASVAANEQAAAPLRAAQYRIAPPDSEHFEVLDFEGPGWEGEVSRTSAEYIRWVQQSLNKISAAGLVVDGISGTMTRAAVKSFQSRMGLAIDGIVGPITEAALLKAGATTPPGNAAPGIVVPQPIPWGPPSSTSSLRNAIVRTTLQERQRWRNGALMEWDDAAFNILVDYWKNGIGLNDSDARNYADRLVHWSAAFISWVMVRSGARPYFTPSSYHSTYIAAAYQNQLQRSSNPIKAYTVRQVAPRPGDLVCTTYPSSTGTRPPADLPLVRPQTSGYHCDIVVQAAPGQLTAMGGNVGNTVGMKTLSIDANGLVKQPRYFGMIRVG
jgi:peptidoglycan hydrolase-like protein with peptidoglycan-binding domain